jgi:MFS transporter, DHA3 family, tetracycline resistance protein
MGCGFALEGAIPKFIAVLAAQAVWGVGYTFISGALEAWIADEAPDRDVGRVYLRGEQADYIGSFIGIPASVLLGLVALNLPLIIGVLLTIALGLALVLTMRSRPKRVLLAVKEPNSSNSDEINRIFVDVWLFGA